MSENRTDTMTAAEYQRLYGNGKESKPHVPTKQKNGNGDKAKWEMEVTGKKVTVNVKPLSVNAAYKGQRWASDELRAFRKELGFALKPIQLPEPPYAIHFVFGQSNPGADWDGGIKAAQDVIAKKYRFNDKLIRRGSAEIDLVPKGEEYISFEITHYEKQK